MKVVAQRWRTARDAYQRDRKKTSRIKPGQVIKQSKKYIFFDDLKFLDTVYNAHTTEKQTQHEAVGTSEPTSFEPKRRRKDDTSDEESVPLFGESRQKIQHESEDADRAFLISLLPALRSLDEDKKLQFRAEVLRIMMDIKNVPPISQPHYNNLPHTNDVYEYKCLSVKNIMNSPSPQSSNEMVDKNDYI